MQRKPNIDLEKLLNTPDEEIVASIDDDPDTYLPDASFWEKAEIVVPQNKQQITLKLDARIVEFFKKGGKGYNTRINAILKSYVDAH